MTIRYGVKTPLITGGSDNFAKEFTANQEHAVFIATASYRGCSLRVESRNEEHYQRTLDYWAKLKATNIQEGTRS